ncbi:MAG: 16S rRNA (guanine(527)-N(7))-methyltransferase RsmG [Neisseria sp.]|nr:16S rRNA (guanine(527)-N(7))-methyltransferase RsmG [Neisseria sp.]
MNLPLSEVAQAQLLAYVRLLTKWNGIYNLTALRDEEQMVSHHVLDSLSLLPFIGEAKTLLDVGSGGGMPGIPVAIARPDLTVTLLDANSKKTTFLQQAVIELGLNNVTVLTGRVETLGNMTFDVITSRAFAELNDFVRVTRQLLAPEGCWAALKGVYPYEEIAQLPADIAADHVHAVQVAGIDAQRHIVMLSLRKGM